MTKKVYSFNVTPIIQVMKRYQLDSDKLSNIILNFLSHRREEILNEQLFRAFSPFEMEIKRTLKPILYQLINELDVSDNVSNYFIKNNVFYIEDYINDESTEQWE